MTEHLFERLRWVATLAIVAALAVAGPAIAATPRQAFYGGTGLTGAGNYAKVKLQVNRSKSGKNRVTILKAIDGCFGVSPEGSPAAVLNGDFAINAAGGAHA